MPTTHAALSRCKKSWNKTEPGVWRWGGCGRCKTVVSGHSLPPLTEIEQRLLSPEEIEQGYRLACQTVAKEEARLYIPPTSLVGKQRLYIAGAERYIKPSPIVRKFLLRLPPADLQDARSDFARIRDVLRKVKGVTVTRIDPELLKDMSQLLRNSGWSVTIVMREGEIVGLDPGDTSDSSYGLAIDLGTSRVALYLVDLRSGETVLARGMMNPQSTYGEDVMSRIHFALAESSGQERLRKELLEGINRCLDNMCKQKDVSPKDILETVVVGNTAMHHLFLGLETRQLAASPFVLSTSEPLQSKARDIGLNTSKSSYVYFPPPIAGFVGSDHTCMLLSSQLHQMQGNCLGIDIGTNTEIAFKARQGIFCCSCASGPAFEAAHIKCGMRAAKGAIEAVHIDPRTLEAEVSTIGGGSPIGICGSGILDCIAQMLDAGLIDPRGRLQAEKRGVRRDRDNSLEYVLVPRKSSDDTELVITQRDIGQIQLAKAAIRTGIDILLEQVGVRVEDIEKVFLAGAFGTFLDPSKAIRLGMLPPLPLQKFVQLGNAAGIGAKEVLISRRARETATRISRAAKYIELTNSPKFSRYFAAALKFPP